MVFLAAIMEKIKIFVFIFVSRWGIFLFCCDPALLTLCIKFEIDKFDVIGFVLEVS